MPAVTNQELWATVDLLIRNRHVEYPANHAHATALWRLLMDEGASGTQHCPQALNYVVREAAKAGREEERALIVTMAKKGASQ